MKRMIVVTGATGSIGRPLVERLLAANAKVRIISRSPERAAPLVARGAEGRIGDIQNAAFLTDAFRGAEIVFAMIPEHPQLPDYLDDKRRSARSIADAVRAAGVKRVVAISAIGVVPPTGIGPAAPNGELEGILKSIKGLSVVAIRPAFLMENHMGAIALIKQAGINGSAVRGSIPFAMISTRDIAAVAADYLLVPTFQGYIVRELLGPRDYTYREATSILGAAIGRPDLPYVEMPYDGLKRGLLSAGFSADAADALVQLQSALNEGRVQRLVSRGKESTTPATLEDFARDVFAPAFNGMGGST